MNGSLDFWLELPFEMESLAGQADLEETIRDFVGIRLYRKTYRINNSMVNLEIRGEVQARLMSRQLAEKRVYLKPC